MTISKFGVKSAVLESADEYFGLSNPRRALMKEFPRKRRDHGIPESVRKPKKIGILSDYRADSDARASRVPFRYVSAVEKAGGVAYIVPCNASAIDHYVDDLDAFVFPGGADIDPALYGDAVHGAVDFIPEHDGFLYRFLDRAVAARKPVFGICKGMQLINVYFGGTLVQHLPTADDHHRPERRTDHVHTVEFHGDSRLRASFSDDVIPVNSIHHQAVDRLGDGLRVTARSSGDGTVEAVEHETLPIMGVQWHPECLSEHVPVFRTFVERCGK